MLYDNVCTVHNVLELKVTKLSEVISILHKTHNSTCIAIQSRQQSWHATNQKVQSMFTCVQQFYKTRQTGHKGSSSMTNNVTMTLDTKHYNTSCCVLAVLPFNLSDVQNTSYCV